MVPWKDFHHKTKNFKTTTLTIICRTDSKKLEKRQKNQTDHVILSRQKMIAVCLKQKLTNEWPQSLLPLPQREFCLYNFNFKSSLTDLLWNELNLLELLKNRSIKNKRDSSWTSWCLLGEKRLVKRVWGLLYTVKKKNQKNSKINEENL